MTDESRQAVTLHGQTLRPGMEVRTAQQFMNVAAGIYLRVEDIYEVDSEPFVVFTSANGIGPGEIDAPAEVVCQNLGRGKKLVFDEYDSEMHD